MTRRKRVLYLQYTNPANYPPLEHSSRILADADCEVVFVGKPAQREIQFEMPPHAHREVILAPGGYRSFLRAALSVAKKFKPDWCYLSDYNSAAAGLIVRRLTTCKIVYHEHDFPFGHDSYRRRVSLWARRRLLRTADVVVVPSDGRKRLMGVSDAVVVMNCPSLREIDAAAHPPRSLLRIVYAGTVTPERLPPVVIDALTSLPDVELDVYGYATAGFSGYPSELRQRALAAGIGNRVSVHDPVATRETLLQRISEGDVGLCLLDDGNGDPNHATMAGASNKPFDYLARGVALLCADTPQWNDMFVAPGYALSCDMADRGSITRAITRLRAADLRHEMVEKGSKRLRSEWNYEHQFQPVAERILRT